MHRRDIARFAKGHKMAKLEVKDCTVGDHKGVRVTLRAFWRRHELEHIDGEKSDIEIFKEKLQKLAEECGIEII